MRAMSGHETEDAGTEGREVPPSAYIGYTGSNRDGPSLFERFVRLFSPSE